MCAEMGDDRNPDGAKKVRQESTLRNARNEKSLWGLGFVDSVSGLSGIRSTR